MECGKILLDFNADIDALNYSGYTSFHVVSNKTLVITLKAAEKQDMAFGNFLLKNRARKHCRTGCLKCRLFVKQIEKNEHLLREQAEQERL